jgi:hypothetical protein
VLPQWLALPDVPLCCCCCCCCCDGTRRAAPAAVAALSTPWAPSLTAVHLRPCASVACHEPIPTLRDAASAGWVGAPVTTCATGRMEDDRVLSIRLVRCDRIDNTAANETAKINKRACYLLAGLVRRSRR